MGYPKAISLDKLSKSGLMELIVEAREIISKIRCVTKEDELYPSPELKLEAIKKVLSDGKE